MALSPTHPGVGAPSADGRRTTRGLLPLLFTGNTAMYALYLGVGGVLLPLQVEQLDAAHKVANLGLVSGVAAIFATFFNPLAGALSDRSGRRNPWILGGGLATVAAMALLGSVDTVLLVAIAWCLGQAVMNFYQSALTSVVPDRVPLGRRGAASAAVGLGLPVGSTVGVLVASACSDHYRTGYLVLGVLVALAAVLFTSAAREQRMPAKSPTPLREQAAAFLGVLREHDFRWAFIGRWLLVLGYFAVVGYQLYILQDHIALPAGLEPTEAVAVLTPVSAVTMALSTVVGGVLSDRLDRRKLFVGVSAALSGVALLISVVSPTWPGMLVFAAVNGLAFGCFMAVDTALVTMVLPKAEDAARDMGVLNIANAGPQILAPFVASAVVGLGGYTPLFVLGALLSVLGALAVRPIRSVR
ncbi:MFS family permease [Kitasatospora gansuensis]|uniref:MFS family permease n=1 Tax=Kitasatospora gansuensis TaxID=258050 RepID=A0A7W7WJ03_9ACTN|nr:MFS transporter [Kitasatospora gansuensis]MBB4949362.1 MFS family permease [Kitasatospora gansuensis]